jgi:CheY-like chemotaxis protein
LQHLINFGSNAIKYNRSGGHVTFHIAREDELCRIVVADDGIGIPEDQRAKIFEPFHRAGQETGPIQGTGIGLAISKRLALLMQGGVGFETETGRGSKFWVDVPIEAETVVVSPIASVAGLAPSGSRAHKVVYIEDNPSNIAFMRDLIDQLPSMELITAPTAEIGIELVRSHQPSVVIMDINLPGMSGIEATKVLRELPETRHIPVIALTAAALVQDARRNREAGFYRYLTKPVKVDELTSVLAELVS